MLLRPRRLAAAVLALSLVPSAALTTPLLLAAAPSAAATPAAVTLGSLKLEDRTEPIGVDVDRPRFSWVVDTQARGVVQTSYRVRVATADDGLDGDLVWDSGVVASAESSQVEYAGPALASATGYVWDVLVVTSAGTATASSSFRTGLRTDADWAGAAWIGNERPARSEEITLAGASWIHPPYTGANTPPGYFRQTFTVDPGKQVASAELVMTGDLGYSAFLNGVQVDAGASVADAWKQATRVQVHPTAGQNLLAVRLNNTAKAYAAFVAKLVVRYADGSTDQVVSDDTWLSSQSAGPGWHLAGYDTAGWVRAAARAAYGSGPWGAQVSVPTSASPDVSMNLDTASWIIPPIGEPTAANPIPTTLFRRDVAVDPDKEVAWAQLSITGDQVFTAYWNGTQVAANTGANNEWAQARTVNLTPTAGDNVLAVRLQTPGTSQYGGILGRVRIAYTDGTSEDVVTDASTLALATPSTPDGWTEPGFDDAAWPQARAEALYRGWVYGDRVTVPQVATGTESLDFEGARWIWTPEATTPVAPAEDRAFRTTWTTPAAKQAVRADVLITADDSYRLVVGGTLVGSSEGVTNDWQQSRAYTVDLAPDRNVFAVRTTNGPDSAAGLLVVVRVHYADGTSDVFRTDETWRATKQIPADWAAPGLDDSGWGAAVTQAVYGSGPWGRNVKAPQPAVNPAPLLRKEFDVAHEVSDATLYVAAGGYADVTLNGSKISDDVLSPGYTDYDDAVQYVGTDVTDQLERGGNALGIELGRGFYGMTGGNVWNWQNPPWHDEPVVRAVLEIEYADGSVDHVVTDDSWTIHDGPTRFDDLYGGELYDAGKVQTGFDEVGFDDRSWAAASEVAGPRGQLVDQRQQPIRVTESLPAVEITEPVDGTYVVKFPRVLAGWVKVSATGPAGTTIRYQYGEKLLDSGLVNFSNNGGFASGFQTDRFVLAGTGEPETWAPKFSYKGFQYIQVTGWPGDQPPPLSAFTAQAVHTDAARTGSFESSSTVMNKTHEAVVDTLLNNIHGIPTDTPMFEKNGWTGDAAVGAEMFMMNLDVHELFAKWMNDIADTREPDGRPMVIAPSSGDWGVWGIAPPWHSAYVMIPWWLYQYGSDDRVLREQYDNMRKYVELEYDTSGDGIVDNARLGDWVSPEASPAGSNAPEDIRVSATAYLYTMLDSMARSADHLGKAADAAQFRDQASAVKDAFNAAFLDKAKGYYRGTGDTGYRQTHNVLALAFGLAPDAATEKRVAASIVADVDAKGGHLNTGVLGTKYLLPVLTEHGYADVAYRLAVQTTYPSWGYMIDQGATSMWEHWSLDARSRGHYFLGTVDDWYYHDVAGIQPSETSGYRDVTIAPAVTDQLDWARATTATPYGPVTSDWRHVDGDLVLDVTVPVGSTGHVVVPAASAVSVSEGDGLADSADGVSSAEYADGALRLTVGSGHYEFRVDDSLAPFGAVLDRIEATRSRIETHADAGDLSDADHRSLGDGLSGVRTAVESALGAARDGETAAVVTRLGEALAAARALRGATAGSATIDAPVRGDLVRHLDALVSALDTLLSQRVGVSAVAVPLTTAVLPGDRVSSTVSVTNTGTSALTDVVATVDLGGWQVDDTASTAGTLPAGASVSLPFTATVPADADPGDRPATVRLTYRLDGAQRSTSTSGPWATVTSGLEVGSVDVARPDPSGPARATVTVRNTGSSPVDGRVELTVPDGWPATVPSAPVSVPAGKSVEVEVPLLLPARVVATTYPVTARFARGAATLAEGAGSLAVDLATPPADAVDHVDFGESDSEQAHAVEASEFSGISSEAGLTRRYAHSLHPGSWYSALVDVTPGEPFGLRLIETFDKATTKEFNLYADDVLVGRYTVTRTENSVGWMAHDLVVDAPAAVAETADGSVRLKFEFPVDATAYDPSIADVWVLPGRDAQAPLAAVRVDGTVPGRSGWQRGPTDVSVVATDDRSTPVVDVGGDDGWQPYAGPVRVAGDGSHRIDYRARDAAGNTTGAHSATVRIDGTAPTTTLGLAGSATDATARVRLTATDATSGVAETRYRVDGGAWTTSEGSPVTVSGAGEHVVEASSTDVAGNTEELRRMVVTLSDAPLVAVVAPQVTGTAQVGRTLRATLGSWSVADARLSLQWLRNGRAIPGARARTYRLTAADVGSSLSVRVDAAAGGGRTASATSGSTGRVARAASTTTLRVTPRTVRSGRQVRVAIAVTSPSTTVTGTVRLRLDGRVVRIVRLDRAGRATARLVVRSRGKHRIQAVYAGAGAVSGSSSAVVTVKARAR